MGKTIRLCLILELSLVFSACTGVGKAASTSTTQSQGVGPSPVPAPTPTPTPISTPTPVTNGNCTPPNYSACGFPDATNTGYAPGTVFKTQTADCLVINTPNTVIDSMHIIGCVDVEADNVTIQNSWITSTNWFAIIYGDKNPNVTGLKVLHTTMDIDKAQCPNGVNCNYGLGPNGSGTYEVGWCNISGFKDGLDISTGYIHDNYIWGLLQFDGAHTQDIYVWPGGNGVRIVHNTLISDIVDSTASIYVTDNQGHQQNVTIDNNWLAGGSYALYAGDSTATQIVVTNNKFSTEVTPNGGYYGPITDVYHNTGNVFSGNVWTNGPHAGQAISE